MWEKDHYYIIDEGGLFDGPFIDKVEACKSAKAAKPGFANLAVVIVVEDFSDSEGTKNESA